MAMVGMMAMLADARSDAGRAQFRFLIVPASGVPANPCAVAVN
jgi:hypothetical protein